MHAPSEAPEPRTGSEVPASGVLRGCPRAWALSPCEMDPVWGCPLKLLAALLGPAL